MFLAYDDQLKPQILLYFCLAFPAALHLSGYSFVALSATSKASLPLFCSSQACTSVQCSSADSTPSSSRALELLRQKSAVRRDNCIFYARHQLGAIDNGFGRRLHYYPEDSEPATGVPCLSAASSAMPTIANRLDYHAGMA